MIFLLNYFLREGFERGIFGKVDTPKPVISFGNIHFGGTGKTPHLLEAVRFLTGRGINVCVLTRGYGRREKGTKFVKPGILPPSWESVGDEAFMIKKRIPESALCVSSDRIVAIHRALQEDSGIDLFLMDDGFQQFRVRKNADFILIPYKRIETLMKHSSPFFMREGPGAIRYSSAVIISKVPKVYEKDMVETFIQSYGRGKDLVMSRFRAEGVVDNRGRKRRDPRGKEYFLFGGIGDFESLLELARSSGIFVKGSWKLKDHVCYTPSLMGRVRSRAEGIPLLTTEKDLVKLPFDSYGEINSLTIGVEFLSGRDRFEGILTSFFREEK